MIESSTICYMAIGLIVAILFGLIFCMGCKILFPDSWIPQIIITITIVILLAVSLRAVDNNDAKTEKSVKNTITANYNEDAKTLMRQGTGV